MTEDNTSMSSLVGAEQSHPKVETASGPCPAESGTQKYYYWRTRHLYSTFVGYAIYYFVRKNLPVAMPLMEKDLGISKADLGKFLTLHDVLYGCSKFANGVLGDRSNARWFMAIGLGGSAILNLAFGFSSAVQWLGFWWVANAWFQGMGFPPCARLLSHWFSAAERGRKWGIWNTSHQVGGAVILVLAGWLGTNYGWRSIFIAPAIIALLTTVFLINRLRDTPESMGLPPIEEFSALHLEQKKATEARPVEAEAVQPEDQSVSGAPEPVNPLSLVVRNPYIWLICLANFFVYVVRFSFFNWAPTYLHEVKQISLQMAGNMTANFEIAGLFGSILAGWLADRYSRTPVCVAYMLSTALCVLAFWKTPMGHAALDGLWLFGVGFFIYGPQFLVGVMVTDLAGKRAAGTAIGMTGFFGYLSGILSGYGLGKMVETHGWDPTFQVMLGCCIAAAVPFMCCWKKT
jgi:phosphoglycerate transporter family protein